MRRALLLLLVLTFIGTAAAKWPKWLRFKKKKKKTTSYVPTPSPTTNGTITIVFPGSKQMLETVFMAVKDRIEAAAPDITQWGGVGALIDYGQNFQDGIEDLSKKMKNLDLPTDDLAKLLNQMGISLQISMPDVGPVMNVFCTAASNAVAKYGSGWAGAFVSGVDGLKTLYGLGDISLVIPANIAAVQDLYGINSIPMPRILDALVPAADVLAEQGPAGFALAVVAAQKGAGVTSSMIGQAASYATTANLNSVAQQAANAAGTIQSGAVQIVSGGQQGITNAVSQAAGVSGTYLNIAQQGVKLPDPGAGAAALILEAVYDSTSDLAG